MALKASDFVLKRYGNWFSTVCGDPGSVCDGRVQWVARRAYPCINQMSSPAL